MVAIASTSSQINLKKQYKNKYHINELEHKNSEELML